jgi:2,4-dienoyl-CoA reductase-like NADH-dependent reductase (Old Yellow Enzyme family)
LGVAGKIMSTADANAALAHGADFVLLGRAAILHHDFPQRAQTVPDFASVACPVTREYLRGQRLGPAFIDYMKSFKDFVAD